MTKPPLTVSIIVIAYNDAQYLERALENVYSQSRKPDEVILIDDGSTDDTAQIASRYPDLRYIYQTNQGPSSARNNGVSVALGDVLVFLDADDMWECNKLKREVELLEQDDSLEIVQGQIVDVADIDGIFSGKEEILLPILSAPYHFVNLGSLTIRKSAFQRIGPFDIARKENEDTDWFLRAWESGAHKKTVNQVGLYYTLRKGGAITQSGATSQSLPSLLKQHKDRANSGVEMHSTLSLKEFFIGFPDRSNRAWNGSFALLQLRDRNRTDTFQNSIAVDENEMGKQFNLARIWKKRGRWKQALESYRKVISQKPDHVMAHVEMGKVLEQFGKSEEVVGFYANLLDIFANEAELHKAFIDIFDQTCGLERAFDFYKLKRSDDKKISIVPSSLVNCFVCRNESVRLPYFLEYYRKKGVTHFFAIDNGSSDGSLEYLKEQEDVYLWSSDLSFNRANFGSVWFELVLRSYALGCWCITVDVDEILYYPDCENLSLVDYCKRLDHLGKRILSTVLLEMYSKNPVSTAHCIPGKAFEHICSYFDSKFYHTKIDRAGPFQNLIYFFGGVRERVFGESDAFCQSKVSLIKYDKDCILAGGQHWTNLPEEYISKSRGCLLHFKYFSDFENKVKEEVKRKEHYQGGLQYQQYVHQLEEEKSGFSLYDAKNSVQLEDSAQLVRLGIMKQAADDEELNYSSRLTIPEINTRVENEIRPRWSVMVTVYDRVTHLPRCLQSILSQADSSSKMQVEVIADMISPQKTAQIRKIVEDVGQGRISFHPSPERLGHPHIFNLCIERALGEWVHIVHDDDWLALGYYEALDQGIDAEPNLGAAFCRYALIGNQDEHKWLSCLEREEPGIIENWIERIGIYCRLAFSSMAVKRSVFEELGGFSPSVGSAFDWDMWKRVAVSHPVWFEPQALCYCGRKGDSLTDGLMLNGEQIKDSLLSIELSKLYLPESLQVKISKNAREHYADYALSLAQEQLASGNFEATFRNISSGLKASRSQRIQAKLLRVLSSY